MSHLAPERLADLALEPADATEPERTHLAGCPDCTADLAALDDVRRLAGAEALVPAPARIRARVLEEVRASGVAPPVTPSVAPPVALPAVRRRPRVPLWAAGIAAAVTLVAGLGLGRLLSDDPPAPDPDRGVLIAATDLRALDSDAARGEASAVREDGDVRLQVHARALGGEAGYHEVWLINLDGARMVSLGVLADGDVGEFQVPRGLLDKGYRIVDISVEQDDGDPTHSGVSLARGELA